MKMWLFLFVYMGCLIANAQNVDTTKWDGKHFKFHCVEDFVSAIPLDIVSPRDNSHMIYSEVDYGKRTWGGFTTEFIEKVLKKYLTVDEIRQLFDKKTERVRAHMYFNFNYSGDILYVWFFYPKKVQHILTEDRLYAILQDFLTLKVDVSGFLWNLPRNLLIPDNYGKIYGVVWIPFFYKRNCP